MTSEKTKFSIVIPLYNKGSLIERAVGSVLKQTVQDFEIIIVDDGSTDNGPDIVAAINDSRICLIHQKNQGVSAARNRGIAEAKHDLIAFLDADDEWLPEFLETIKRMAQRYPDCGIYATRYFMRTPKDNLLPAIVRGLPESFEGIIDNYFQIAVRSHPPVWSSATCARKSALIAIGGFPVGVPSGEDLLTWARLAVRHRIAYSMKYSAIYYLSAVETYDEPTTRIPTQDDVVGKGLALLLQNIEADKKYFLRKYCALWHKMRASSYLRHGMRFKTLKEIVLSTVYFPQIKLLLYLFLLFFPIAVVNRIFAIWIERQIGHATTKTKNLNAMVKVMFFMSIYRIGITSQLYYHANIIKNNNIKLLGVSGEGEQYAGLRKKVVQKDINLSIINGLDYHNNFGAIAKSLYLLIKDFQPDIIHVRTNWQLALVLAVKYFHRSKFMILSTIHGYRHNDPRKAIIAKFLIGLSLRMFADRVITPSSFLKNQFSIIGNKRVVIPIGVDDDFFDTANVKLAFSRQRRIVFAGEFRKGKNQDMLIRALRRYIDDTGDEDVFMTLPGKGPYLPQCEQLAVRLGLSDKVCFPEFLDRKSMLECYLNSQFIIVPSNSETFGHCITEPFVLGRVIITKPVGVALDIIKDGETGFIFNNEEELVIILKKVLRNETLCAKISEAALLKRDYLRWSNVAQKYDKLLQEMMRRR